MEYAVLPIVAALATALTLFSGFGLGTIMLPVFAAFFPLDAAVAMTAVVHLGANLSKLVLMGRHADRGGIVRFGVPAVLATLVGAWALTRLAHLEPLATYTLAGRTFSVTPVKLCVGVLVVGFALLDVIPRLAGLRFPPRLLPLGGVLSGFFGGLSGHQGALRSLFLVRSGLGKEAFIGTGVVIACLVDLTRLGVYAGHFGGAETRENWALVALTTAAAVVGAVVGARLVEKVTLKGVQVGVAAALVVFGVLMAAGLV